MNVLSIQSRVTYGYVGNSAAQFVLQRLGHEVWPLDTVSYSNHLGYPTWRGSSRSAEELREVLDGLDLLGVLGRCDAVLSGYLGNAGTGAVVLEAVDRVRRSNPAALYCCDPVIGDVQSGVFVRPEVPPVFTDQLVPRADILVPNAFELGYLTGGGTETLEATLDCVRKLLARNGGGPRVCVVTSLHFSPGRIGTLAATQDAAWLVETPLLDLLVHGTGDSFAALFLSAYLQDGDVAGALARAVSGIYGVLEATLAAGSYELHLIPAQDRLVAPPRVQPVAVG